MKSALRKLGHAARNRYTQAGVGLTALVAAGAAHATTPAQDALTAVETEFTSLLGSAWPVIATVTAGLLGIRIFKKLASRAV